MKKFKKIVFLILCHIIPPAILIIVVEMMQKGSLDAVFHWIAHYPNAFLLNYGIALVLLLFLWTIIGNLYISFGIYFFTSFFTCSIKCLQNKVFRGTYFSMGYYFV